MVLTCGHMVGVVVGCGVEVCPSVVVSTKTIKCDRNSKWDIRETRCLLPGTYVGGDIGKSQL